MNTNQYSDLKPNTSSGRLIFLSKEIEDSLERNDEYNLYKSMHNHVISTSYISPRVKGFPNPFDIHVWDRLAWTDDPNQLTDLSITDITDQRAEQVAQHARTNDLPILISWSGGIDSTLILSAIYKNWEPSLRERVIVKMSNASYFENPYFFNDVIKNNFRYTNLSNLGYDFNNAIVIAGEPGDAITATNTLIELDIVYPGSYQWSLHKQPDALLKWLSRTVDSNDAVEFYELMLDTAKLNGISLETYEDFFWYSKQALTYGLNAIRLISQICTPWTSSSWDNFQQNAIPWYHMLEYRLWSQTNRNNGVKYNGRYGSFKRPFKEYINDVAPNEYYLNYKAKRGSSLPSANKVAALYDDGTLYYLEQNNV